MAQAFARIVKILRFQDFASHLDQPHSFVQKVESLDCRLDVFECCLYCKALGVEPSEGLELLR